MWTVAIFTTTNEVAAVPTTWILNENSNSEARMCWWPNIKKSDSQLGFKYFNSKQIYNMIKEQYTPNSNEGNYLAAKCTEIFENLIDAREYAKVLSGSSEEMNSIKNRNKKRKKKIPLKYQNKCIKLQSTQKNIVKKKKTIYRNRLPTHPFDMHKNKINNLCQPEKTIFDTVSNPISAEHIDFYPISTSTPQNTIPSTTIIDEDLNNGSDNLINNLTNDLLNNNSGSNMFENLTNITQLDKPQSVTSLSFFGHKPESMSVNNYTLANSIRSLSVLNKSPSLFPHQMDTHSDCGSLQDILNIKVRDKITSTDNLCSYKTLHDLMHPILLRLTAIEKVQQKMATNLEIIGSHLVTISGEWSRRKLVELPKIGGCLQQLLPLTTMEHYHVLVNMLKNVEHKQKLIVYLHSVVSKIQSMEIGTVVSRVLDIIITKQLLMEFTFKGTKTKPAFFESVLYKIIEEVTSGLRKSKVMPGNLDPLDTKLSNLVKHAKRDYEMMVKKHSNINAESK